MRQHKHTQFGQMVGQIAREVEAEVTKDLVDSILRKYFHLLRQFTLEEDAKVEVPGVGVFSSGVLQPKRVRSPKDGSFIFTPKYKRLKFTASKHSKRVVP